MQSQQHFPSSDDSMALGYRGSTPGKDGIDMGWTVMEDMFDSIPPLVAPAQTG